MAKKSSILLVSAGTSRAFTVSISITNIPFYGNCQCNENRQRIRDIVKWIHKCRPDVDVDRSGVVKQFEAFFQSVFDK